MKKKFLVIMCAFSMICSSMYCLASSRGTITVVNKTKTFSVPKKYGKIKKISYSYPNKKAKGKVTVKQTGTKIKITGKKNGRVNVKIRFKSNKVKSYKLLVSIKKNKPKVTATPVISSTPKPTVSPTLAPTSSPTVEPTLKPTATPTMEPTVTPTPSDDVEQEDISTLKTLDEQFDVISTNYYEYTKAFIDRYFNDDGICTRFYIRATTIKNITKETRVPDCHVKFYDENGYFVCEYQNSNDSGSTWHKTLKPNEESIILYLAGTNPSKMGMTNEDFSERVKYWKLVDIE